MVNLTGLPNRIILILNHWMAYFQNGGNGHLSCSISYVNPPKTWQEPGKNLARKEKSPTK